MTTRYDFPSPTESATSRYDNPSHAYSLCALPTPTRLPRPARGHVNPLPTTRLPVLTRPSSGATTRSTTEPGLASPIDNPGPRAACHPTTCRLPQSRSNPASSTQPTPTTQVATGLTRPTSIPSRLTCPPTGPSQSAPSRLPCPAASLFRSGADRTFLAAPIPQTDYPALCPPHPHPPKPTDRARTYAGPSVPTTRTNPSQYCPNLHRPDFPTQASPDNPTNLHRTDRTNLARPTQTDFPGQPATGLANSPAAPTTQAGSRRYWTSPHSPTAQDGPSARLHCPTTQNNPSRHLPPLTDYPVLSDPRHADHTSPLDPTTLVLSDPVRPPNDKPTGENPK